MLTSTTLVGALVLLAAAMAAAVMELLGDLATWEKAVEAGSREIDRYSERRYEDRLIAVWSEAKVAHVPAATRPG